MSFANPLALFGLLTLPVILGLHLMRSRNRQLRVSSLSLWTFLRPQLRGASPRRIPLTWLLILDLLIAVLLTLAFARPELNLTRPMREGRHLILILDTSGSMAAADGAPSRLSSALTDARAVIRQAAAQDVLTLLEFGSRVGTLADSRTADFSIRLAALDALQPGGSQDHLDAALALAAASADPGLPAEIHVFTDAAYPPPGDSFPLPVIWHLYGRPTDNLAVLSLQAEPLSAGKFQVFARFANFGAEPVQAQASLYGDERKLTGAEITLEPGTSVAQIWELFGSPRSLRVTLEVEDALPADNSAFTGFDPAAGAPQLAAALVSAQPGPLPRALEAAGLAALQVIAPDEYVPGSPYDLTVFRGTLPERWPAGTVLVVDPPADSPLLGAVRAEPVAALPFPQPDPLLAGVDFTGVRWDRTWVPENLPPDLDRLLTAGDQPLLLHGQSGLTDLVLLLAEVAGAGGAPTPFARHPAFPILIANIVRQAGGVDLPSQIPAGGSLELPGEDRYPLVQVAAPDGAVLELPAGRAPGLDDFRSAGLYEVALIDVEGLESRFTIGVNAGDLGESDLTPQDWPAAFESPEAPTAFRTEPVPLGPWLLGLAAALLLLEAWLAWR